MGLELITCLCSTYCSSPPPAHYCECR